MHITKQDKKEIRATWDILNRVNQYLTGFWTATDDINNEFSITRRSM